MGEENIFNLSPDSRLYKLLKRVKYDENLIDELGEEIMMLLMEENVDMGAPDDIQEIIDDNVTIIAKTWDVFGIVFKRFHIEPKGDSMNMSDEDFESLLDGYMRKLGYDDFNLKFLPKNDDIIHDTNLNEVKVDKNPTLVDLMNQAVEREDYDEAARLRDEIKLLKTLKEETKHDLIKSIENEDYELSEKLLNSLKGLSDDI